jgi:hypothetical protein
LGNGAVYYLETVGGTRGADNDELGTFQATWKGSPVQSFSGASELEAWEANWPNGDGRPAAKIVYDPAAAEVRIFGSHKGKFSKELFLRREIWQRRCSR